MSKKKQTEIEEARCQWRADRALYFNAVAKHENLCEEMQVAGDEVKASLAQMRHTKARLDEMKKP